MFHTMPPTLLEHPDELLPFVTRRTAGFTIAGFLLGTQLVNALGGVKNLTQGIIALGLVLLCMLGTTALAFWRIGARQPEEWLLPLWHYWSRPRRCLPQPRRGWFESDAALLFEEEDDGDAVPRDITDETDSAFTA